MLSSKQLMHKKKQMEVTAIVPEAWKLAVFGKQGQYTSNQKASKKHVSNTWQPLPEDTMTRTKS